MENEKSKIEINIMGDVYFTSIDASSTKTYHNYPKSNDNRYELEYGKEMEQDRKVRERFYRANAL